MPLAIPEFLLIILYFLKLANYLKKKLFICLLPIGFSFLKNNNYHLNVCHSGSIGSGVSHYMKIKL